MKKNNHNSTEREVRDTLSVAPDFVELEEVTTINGEDFKNFFAFGLYWRRELTRKGSTYSAYERVDSRNSLHISQYGGAKQHNAVCLFQGGVEAEGASIAELLLLPIPWNEVIVLYADGFTDLAWCTSGAKYTITVDERYITVILEEAQHSAQSQTCWIVETPIAQYFLNGDDNTAAYKQYCYRNRFNKKITEIREHGLSDKQARRFLKSGAKFKWEILSEIPFLLAKNISSAGWSELAATRSHREFEAVENQIGVGNIFSGKSHPRKTGYAKVMADITK